MEFSNKDKEKLQVIKGHLAEIKRLRGLDKWVESDLILYSLSDKGDLDWLVEKLENLHLDINEKSLFFKEKEPEL